MMDTDCIGSGFQSVALLVERTQILIRQNIHSGYGLLRTVGTETFRFQKFCETECVWSQIGTSVFADK